MRTTISNRLVRHSIVLLSTTLFVLTSIAGSLVTAPAATATPLVEIPAGDRDYPVGGNTGMQPGTWATDGPQRFDFPCAWFRFNAYPVSDFNKQQIGNGGVTGPTKVEILPSDKAFAVRGCKSWHLVSA